MQGDINPLPGRLGVVSIEIQERIKCRSRVRVQKCFPQSRLAGFVNRQILPFVPRITKTHVPVRSLDILAKFPHLTTQPHVDELIPVNELFVSRTCVVNTAKLDSVSHGQTASVGKEIWNGRIRDREGVKGILKWHTDAGWIKGYVSAWLLEWIGRK